MNDRRKREEKVSGRRRATERKSEFGSTMLRLPPDVSQFQLKDTKTRRVEIVPYVVGAGNPWADAGELHYERTFWAHRGIGAGEDWYVCPQKTAKRKCPICEHRAELARDSNADDDLIKSLAPKERQLWNLFDHADPDKGVQVWEISFHLFGKLLDSRIEADSADPDAAGYEYFADPREGATLRIGVSEEAFSGNKFYEVSDIDFKTRKKPLDQDILNAATCLDKCLIVRTYDELHAIYHQLEDVADVGEEGEDEEEEPAVAPKPKPKAKPAPKAKPKPADEDEDWGDATF